MKKLLAIVVAAIFVVAVTGPVFAQAHVPVAPKSTEGSDVRKVEPKGTEGPDVKKSKKSKSASTVKLKPTEEPEDKKVEPKGTEGPNVKKAPAKQ
jgi:hypothetical protein